jgi:CHRD domain
MGWTSILTDFKEAIGMSKTTLAMRALGVAAALVVASALPASGHTDGDTGGGPPTPGGALFFVADMNGTNLPPADLDGTGRAIFRFQGAQACWLITWKNIVTPMLGHIHEGGPGVNGPVVVGFWRGQLPEGITGVTGCSTSTPETLARIAANPAAFYANVHNTDFPGGAIRAQLRPINVGVDFNQILRQPLIALMDGLQEVPAAGDQDGRGVSFVGVRGTTVRFALSWSAIAQPSAGHIHAGSAAQAGPVVVPFFAAPGGLPAGLTGVSGEVMVDAAVARQISRHPSRYYTNLHNAEFPAGAIRGQLTCIGS